MSFAILMSLAFVGVAHGQGSIDGIGPVGEIEKVQDGFQFTEGPASDGEGTLYFTDIPAETIFQLSADGKISPLTTTSGHANGLMFDGEKHLIACQMDGQVVRIDRKTKDVEVLAGQYEGKRFNAPNDLVIDRQGGVYFTDPLFRAPEPLPQGTQGFYYIAPDKSVTQLDKDLPAPNGIALSPDEKTLYVIPSMSAEMLAYDVKEPGKIENRRVFCRLKQKQADGNSGGDGMTIDTKGNLYITAATGVQVFDPSGKMLGNIAFPQQPANVTFGGPDRKTLYVTARTGLYRCAMEAAGHVYPGVVK
ncbi:MAG: SMP-30/gluconolactonase/LRE family protein [Pirellulaceae bacterium]